MVRNPASDKKTGLETKYWKINYKKGLMRTANEKLTLFSEHD